MESREVERISYMEEREGHARQLQKKLQAHGHVVDLAANDEPGPAFSKVKGVKEPTTGSFELLYK